ncbi:hypothetical protein [Arthrobacter sp. StoSoilB20]|uniref:hypothetical protein n=1 Tax=Arthrobacter sp. StoSoilB20 TaxID=2830995 RepID=UPI001CC7BEC2|nr:hypothetical protein [Arthrobacter sp. StoSoilB20]BCW59898.1 hypothetical protein StoSoilB20_32450 [Arthrobacter sp. StoSoilB20]
MSFFDDLPEPPERARQPQPLRPGWAGPPSDELPGVVTAGGFVHQSQRMVAALKLVEVYSTGCLLDLVWSVRRRDESDQEWREIVEESYNHPRSSLDTRAGLELGVALADGHKAVAAIHGPASFEDTGDVTGPVLTTLGGGGGSNNTDYVQFTGRYWLWPLPLDGDTTLVARWDALGMPESSLELSGVQLGEALGRVRNYWME